MSRELLPPGFRFHPTDEELIIHYLQNQATSRPCPVPIIPEIDIYKFDPWELPGESDARDGEWYFFSLRNRKYPNGTRPNRATKSGYWKATGNDKSIHSRSRFVGTKKALVFYTGRPPRGSKTGWVMHEYRLPAAIDHNHLPSDSMRLVDWVLCRIYIKGKKKSTNTSTSTTTASSTTANTEQEIASIAHLLEYSHECISVSELFEDSPFYSIDDLFQICTTDSSSSTTGDSNANFYSADAMVPMENHIFQH